MSLSELIKPDRTHIQDQDLRFWSKHWNVTLDHIRLAMEKAGNSASAVEKELMLQNLLQKTAD